MNAKKIQKDMERWAKAKNKQQAKANPPKPDPEEDTETETSPVVSSTEIVRYNCIILHPLRTVWYRNTEL